VALATAARHFLPPANSSAAAPAQPPAAAAGLLLRCASPRALAALEACTQGHQRGGDCYYYAKQAQGRLARAGGCVLRLVAGLLEQRLVAVEELVGLARWGAAAGWRCWLLHGPAAAAAAAAAAAHLGTVASWPQHSSNSGPQVLKEL
jgi:hypothetical protein